MINHNTKNEKNEQKEKNGNIPLKALMMRGWLALLLCAALITFSATAVLVQYDKRSSNDVVIILDPGHGGSDIGAYNSALGLYESSLTLKIALACRDRLEQYDGVRVYMTHTGVNSSVGKSSLSSRVRVAGEVGADIFISLHINSAENKEAGGAEVYVPVTTHEPKYNEECTKLAEKMLDNFQALGLKSRGVKTRKSSGGRVYTFSDGTTEIGDYYYVIGESISRLGIPGILVEHAFIAGDAEFLDSDEDLQALGVADAEAIASHYGLTLKPQYVDTASADASGAPAESQASAPAASDTTSDVSSAVSPHISSQPVSSDPFDNDFTSEDDDRSDIAAMEAMIRALPETPTESDGNQIKAVRTAFIALGESRQRLIDAALYQKLCNVITAYENLVHPVRMVVKQGSQLSVDRVNGRLLNVETAAQSSGKITVFSIMLELDLLIDPSAPEEYKQEGVLDYRVISPEGKSLGYDDTVPNHSVISILYHDVVLDTLTVSISD